MPDRWPNFFLAGTPKAGTTSLYRYLGEHPQIYMTPVKEPHFFDESLPEADGEEDRQRAIDEYLSLYEAAEDEPIRGEATPGYFAKPGTIERIHEHCPDARFVVSLRDPIAAIHSAYLMRARRGQGEIGEEPAGFEAYVDEILEAEPGTRTRYPLEGRRYATHYKRFLETFDEDDIHVLLLDDLSEHPRETLEDIAAFLDIDREGVDGIDLETVHNPFGVPRNALAEWLLTDERVHKAAQLVVPEPVRVFLGEHVLVEKDEKPPRGDEAPRRLAEILGPEIDELESLLDRDLSPLKASWPDASTQPSPKSLD